MKTIYETERLVLKVLDRSKPEVVLDYYLRNEQFLEEWEATKNESFYTIDIQRKNLGVEFGKIKKQECLRLWIFKKEDTDFEKTIGTLSFSNIVRGAFQSCFLGYKLDGNEINKGYMTEAIKKGIEIMFDDYKLHRIEANVMPKNKRSLRVLDKLGFYNEGLAKKYLRINGKWEDHIHMVMLNDAME